jgi:uncharacterized short protein YbdD (DUF466 family)
MRMLAVFANAARVVRRMIGVPDYDSYVAHLRRCHPEATPLPYDAFVRDVLVRRYERPGARCC